MECPKTGPASVRKVDDAGLSQTDYVKAAFTWQYNLIGLVGVTAYSVVSGAGLPLVLAAGLELMYLAMVPQNGRFRRLVRSWKFADEKQERKKRLTKSIAIFTGDAQPGGVCSRSRKRYAPTTHNSTGSQVLVTQMDDKLRVC